MDNYHARSNLAWLLKRVSDSFLFWDPQSGNFNGRHQQNDSGGFKTSPFPFWDLRFAGSRPEQTSGTAGLCRAEVVPRHLQICGAEYLGPRVARRSLDGVRRLLSESTPPIYVCVVSKGDHEESQHIGGGSEKKMATPIQCLVRIDGLPNIQGNLAIPGPVPERRLEVCRW